MRSIGLDGQDVDPSGVVTGRSAFNLSSSRSAGDEEPPTDGRPLKKSMHLQKNDKNNLFSS
ncbi:hypothetical protein [Rummeliibacillus sp. SL167]|uniref:hypothetical protein n=1 Tax=Rummeliibacillus sp. SL167 TaxID=2579792 RepID=UPI0011B6BAD8|nr:hypothetical protein [Rummeliibacillus sp. SL167]